MLSVASLIFLPNCSQASLRSPREDVGWGVEVREASRGHRALPPPARAGAQLIPASVRGKGFWTVYLKTFLINLIMFKDSIKNV